MTTATVFSERLRLARRERGMSREQFAQRAGIERTMISKYEHGQLKPAMDNLVKIVRTLDCSADWILGLED